MTAVITHLEEVKHGEELPRWEKHVVSEPTTRLISTIGLYAAKGLTRQ